MKVLLCHNAYQQPGGEDRVYADEARVLESHGHPVVRFEAHNASIDGLSRWSVARRAVWNEQVYADVRALIRRERPAVMHCVNTFPLISPAAHYAARAEGVAVVQALHNYRLHCANGYFLRDGRVCEDCLGQVPWRAVLHRCYRHSYAGSAVVAVMQAAHRAWRTDRSVDLYVTCSDFARRKFIEGGMSADRIVTKPNFVHPDPGAGSGRGAYVVFVGRLSPEKGVHTLLDAWSRIRRDVRLTIVGDGPLRDRVLEAQAADPRITWLGQCSEPEVRAVVKDAAVLLVTSTWYENAPRVIVEAFAVGTPVLASRIGALTELVDEGRTGLHFEPGDASDLAARVEQLLTDPVQLVRMRRAAREEYVIKYGAARNYRLLMQVYARAVAARTRPQRGIHDGNDCLARR